MKWVIGLIICIQTVPQKIWVFTLKLNKNAAEYIVNAFQGLQHF